MSLMGWICYASGVGIVGGDWRRRMRVARRRIGAVVDGTPSLEEAVVVVPSAGFPLPLRLCWSAEGKDALLAAPREWIPALGLQRPVDSSARRYCWCDCWT